MPSFFENQERARHNTHVFVLLMALAVFALGCALYPVLFFIVEFKNLWRPLLASDYPDLDLMHGFSYVRPDLFALGLLGTAAFVLIASATRTVLLTGGGAQIAELMGGRLVSGSPRTELERRLLNVVEEMAIAAGIPVPQVFVLDLESGINAFAAGSTPHDAAIGVTRGCVEKLTRDELQGVIGHEFSHVLNGDMALNMRMMGIVYGITCLATFGRDLMNPRTRKGDAGAPLLLPLGFVVWLIGSLGEVCGQMIKAAVSREREFLADASAVQFTRNPDGIVGALKKIGGWSVGGDVTVPQAEEISHFFFGEIRWRAPGSMLATHPPLEERIKRIDPSFDGAFADMEQDVALVEDEGPVRMLNTATPNAAARRAPHAAAVVAQVGSLSHEGLEEGMRLLQAFPAGLRQAADSPFSACAAVFALLLADDAAVRKMQLAQIERSTGAGMCTETNRLAPAVDALRRRDRLSFVALLAPALRALSADQRTTLCQTVQALIDADKQTSIFEYILAHTLFERLSPDSNARALSRVHVSSLSDLRAELGRVLSLLAYAGSSDRTSVESAFAAGAGRVEELQLALLSPDASLLDGLWPAIISLRSLAPLQCGKVVDACAHTVLADGRVIGDEDTLLGAVCDALGCPLPPLPNA
jgi:Zn-dependent protease with chaperone function